MRHDTLTDSSPPRTDRTTQPGGLHRAGFESTLPPEALNELLKRRQPVEKTAKRPPARPPSLTQPAHDWRGLALALLGLALVAIIVMSRWRQPSQPVQPQATPTAVASPATPAVQAPVVQTPVVQTPEVRRALPVLVPRAELVDLPVLLSSGYA
jgi:hypothetical protein